MRGDETNPLLLLFKVGELDRLHDLLSSRFVLLRVGKRAGCYTIARWVPAPPYYYHLMSALLFQLGTLIE